MKVFQELLTRYKIYLLLTLLCFLAFFNNFHVPFFYDDYNQVANNPNLFSIFDIRSVIFCGLRQIRVIQNITFAIDHSLNNFFYDKYFFFHFTNNLLHLFCSFLVFKISRNLVKRTDSFHFLVAALFLVAPLQVSSVTYIMGRIGILQNLSIFLIIYELSKFDNRSEFKVFFLLIFSYLVKENNILLPLLILVFDFFLYPVNLTKIKFKKFYLVNFLTILVMLGFYYILKDPWGGMYKDTVGFKLYWPVHEYFLTQGFYFFFTLFILFNPSESLIYHEYFDFNWGIGTLGIIFWLGCLIAFIYVIKTRKNISFYKFNFLYFLIFYASTNSILQMINPYAEYRTSLYLLPIIFFLVGGIYWIGDKIKMDLKYILISLTLYFGIFVHLNNEIWRHQNRPWILSYQSYPNSNIVNQEMARLYMTFLNFDLARKHLKLARDSGRKIPFHQIRSKINIAGLFFIEGKNYENIKYSKEIIKELYYWDYEFFHNYLISLYVMGEMKEYDRIMKILKDSHDYPLIEHVKESVREREKMRNPISEEKPLIKILKAAEKK
ncbi:MAG: hypothetical protein ACOYL6_04950 [Bacteriovoracaceae bacterium]